jgi:hypothetical protein
MTTPGEFREFGKAMIDYVADYLEGIRDRRVVPTASIQLNLKVTKSLLTRLSTIVFLSTSAAGNGLFSLFEFFPIETKRQKHCRNVFDRQEDKTRTAINSKYHTGNVREYNECRRW